jgi:hypothetical protein
MKLIYINPGNSSVAESQVFSLLEYFTKRSFCSEIVLIQGYRNLEDKKKLIKKVGNFRIKIIWMRSYPNYFFFNFLARLSLKVAVIKAVNKNKNVLFHVRGELYGSMLTRILPGEVIRRQILVDIRGAAYEEYLQYFNGIKIIKRLKGLNIKKAYKSIHTGFPITVVSNALKNHLNDNYSFSKESICVHHNIAMEGFIFDERKRQETRKELGIKESNKVIAISSGGDAKWQNDLGCIDILLDQGYIIMNLGRRSIQKMGVINAFVDFNDMPKYLCSADYALLWREPNEVNRVASPSKFSEFVCSGLWVIHNGSIEIVNEFILTTRYGTIVNSVNELPNLINLLPATYNRQVISKMGQEQFGINQIANSYILTYKKISDGTYLL